MERNDLVSPAEKAGILSKMFFGWMTPFIRKYYGKVVELKDLYKHRSCDSAQRLGDVLEREWAKELDGVKLHPNGSLFKALVRTFASRFLVFSVLGLVGQCSTRILQGIFLGWVVRHFSGIDCVDQWSFDNFFVNHTVCSSRTQYYLSAAGIPIITAAFLLFLHPFMAEMEETGMKLRIALSTLIYKKTLRLSQTSLQKVSSGYLVNVFSNDLARFDQYLTFFPYLMIAPVYVILTSVVLFQYLGVASIVGTTALILITILQSIFAKVLKLMRSKISILTDERIRLINESLTGMKVIKMNSWEKMFLSQISAVRKDELGKIRWTSLLKSLSAFLVNISSKILIFVAVLMLYAVDRSSITPEVVFVTLHLYNSLRQPASFFVYALGLASGAEVLNSFQRIKDFLLLDELTESDNPNTPISNSQPEIRGVTIKDITCCWNTALQECTLQNISLCVKEGELLAVCGPVGSGKSSLLLALLGELPLIRGTVSSKGKIAYASQEPYILNEDVRSNILFGCDYDERKYQEVLHACALQKDLTLLPQGDQTLVGERGFCLSGGQKARIGLARAVYSDADIYLMDDPLSAVDVGVAKHIFETCINGMLKNKTKVLVTHQLRFLPSATYIMILKDGRCIFYGDYEELRKTDHNSLILSKISERSLNNLTEYSDPDVTPVPFQNVQDQTEKMKTDADFQKDSDQKLVLNQVQNSDNPKMAENRAETKASGNLKVFWSYLRSSSQPIVIFLVIIICILSQTMFNGGDVWLSIWTMQYSQWKMALDHFNTTYDHDLHQAVPLNNSPSFYVHVYSGIFGALLVFGLTRFFVVVIMCTESSNVLHQRMLRSIFHVPLSFFDLNPSGRILNRFSKDMTSTDELIPATLLEIISVALLILGILVVESVAFPYHVVTSLILVFLFYYIRKIYLWTASQLKGIEATTRSPVISHISTSLHGLTTIRAQKVQDWFLKGFYERLDCHTTCWYLLISSTKWLGIILDWISLLYMTVIIVVLVLCPTDGGNTGLVVSTALFLSHFMHYAVQVTSGLESQITAVERIEEYSDLKPETDKHFPSSSFCVRDWPQKGRISLKNVSLTYRKGDPPALLNCTCTFEPMEKVGIVGRTGAGKSSIVAALFRLAETKGVIEIDGVDTGNIALQDLRSKISVIPQDPFLFLGTIRKNIDPLGKHDDCSLWAALDKVQLKDTINVLPKGLDTILSEGGNSFSVGQKQLLCLARALVNSNRILVLDEATANVDSSTDVMIQRTIREKCSDFTVITIAHRLNTVMESDRILVLDKGEIQEFDKPTVLLQNKEGFLSKMIQNAGPLLAAEVKSQTWSAENVQGKHDQEKESLKVDSSEEQGEKREINGEEVCEGTSHKEVQPRISSFIYSEYTRM